MLMVQRLNAMVGFNTWGTLLELQLSMTQHINAKCRATMGNMLKIKQIQNMLTNEACQTIVFELVLLHLVYLNTVLSNLPNSTVSKMQRVQNIACHIVLHNEQNLAQLSAFKNCTSYQYDNG